MPWSWAVAKAPATCDVISTIRSSDNGPEGRALRLVPWSNGDEGLLLPFIDVRIVQMFGWFNDGQARLRLNLLMASRSCASGSET
jgi:hypothetical protein